MAYVGCWEITVVRNAAGAIATTAALTFIPYAEALSGLPRQKSSTILGNSFPGPYRLPMLIAHSGSRNRATPNA